MVRYDSVSAELKPGVLALVMQPGAASPPGINSALRYPMPSTQDPLQARLHAWALQAVDAASVLLQLYTKLGDGPQRHRSIRVLDIVRAWLAQYPGKPQHLPQGPPLQPEDAAAELDRWRTTLEATTGILVFLTLARTVRSPRPACEVRSPSSLGLPGPRSRGSSVHSLRMSHKSAPSRQSATSSTPAAPP